MGHQSMDKLTISSVCHGAISVGDKVSWGGPAEPRPPFWRLIRLWRWFRNPLRHGGVQYATITACGDAGVYTLKSPDSAKESSNE